MRENPAASGLRVWVDIGGTFTDCLVHSADGRRLVGKVLSSGVTKGSIAEGSTAQSVLDPDQQGTVDEFWKGFTLRLLDPAGQPVEQARVERFEGATGRLHLERRLLTPPQVGSLYELAGELEAPVLAVRRLLGLAPHVPLPPLEVRMGTTRGTNALLTRRGAATAFVTTEGFGDCLEIGEQDRPDLFALNIEKRSMLYNAVAEVKERVAADGSILQHMDDDAVRQLLDGLKSSGIESLAVCLLNSYKNPQHEKRIGQLAERVGFSEVSLSHEVAPVIKLVARAETTVLDAYLNPILRRYLERVESQFGGEQNVRLWLMTSEGRLVRSADFRGRDSILSGPAGGVVALAAAARSIDEQFGERLMQPESLFGKGPAAIRSPAQPEARGHEVLLRGRSAELRPGSEKPRRPLPVIGFDMGGTSTDVSRYDGVIDRQLESRKAGIRVMTPTVAVHTVAAGGGSICRVVGDRLLVGPESAASDPGPACYGRGGPLAVTDLNVVLGRIDAAHFPFALDIGAARRRLRSEAATLAEAGGPQLDEFQIAEGFWKIAVTAMAEAIRAITSAEGVDPRDRVLVGFGGAAAQHVCGVADALGITRILDHPEASVFSALGIGLSDIGYTVQQSVLAVLDDSKRPQLQNELDRIRGEASSKLNSEGLHQQGTQMRDEADVRYSGTDSALTLKIDGGRVDVQQLHRAFEGEHRQRYGFARAGRQVEVVTLRSTALVAGEGMRRLKAAPRIEAAPPARQIEMYINGRWQRCADYQRSGLAPGMSIAGPARVTSARSTLVIEADWSGEVLDDGTVALQRPAGPVATDVTAEAPAEDRIAMEIFARRLQGIAESMGEVLRRTAVSVNVKERRDFSCAVFDAEGSLIANAPHVPVHLGAMGHTVRHLMQRYSDMRPGDLFVTNDPFHGGSHLPDVTLVMPVFIDDDSSPSFFVANRAHHAEIGGRTPGSMPPDARQLDEEGVVIRDFRWNIAAPDELNRLAELLQSGPYPSRNPQENMADIAAQQAAAVRGIAELEDCCRRWGRDRVQQLMHAVLDAAERAVRRSVERMPTGKRTFRDALDDGTQITVRVEAKGTLLTVDFQGTAPLHPGNFNAPRAITTAALLYVLRCLTDEELPLCEGALRPIELRIPPGVLDPAAALREGQPLPAVVAGNVETSCRVVDCLLGALQAAAASQGTMNNLLIGDSTFGYYETLCGGAGATASAAGASAVHTHMTNTRITDPEILEARLPLRLRRFGVRRGSGGEGHHRGGDGAVREIEFLKDLTVSLLSNRRGQNRPYGLAGGSPGAAGENWLLCRDRPPQTLSGCCTIEVRGGDVLRILTPGGGGWGEPSHA